MLTCRCGLALECGRWRRDFPLGIVVVNVTGSLVLGLLVGVLVSDRAGSAVYALVGTGVLGGYTTFSTASLDAVLWGELGWQKVGIHELVSTSQVKIRYTKAIAKLHPDKVRLSVSNE